MVFKLNDTCKWVSLQKNKFNDMTYTLTWRRPASVWKNHILYTILVCYYFFSRWLHKKVWVLNCLYWFSIPYDEIARRIYFPVFCTTTLNIIGIVWMTTIRILMILNLGMKYVTTTSKNCLTIQKQKLSFASKPLYHDAISGWKFVVWP